MSIGKYPKLEEDIRKRSSLTRAADNTKISTTFGQITERSRIEKSPSDSSGIFGLVNFTGIKSQDLMIGEDFALKEQRMVS